MEASQRRVYAAQYVAAVWHEALHGLLDPLADINVRRIRQSAPLDVREHIAQAVALRLIEREKARFLSESLNLMPPQRPGLDPMVMAALDERLKKYERLRGPRDLAAYYARLLEAFPKAEGKAVDLGDWLEELVAAFPSDGARRAGAETIGRALAGGHDAELLLRRAALRWLLGDTEGASADARQAARAPAAAARGLTLQAILALEKGEEKRGAALLRRARRACGDQAAVCKDIDRWIDPASAARSAARPTAPRTQPSAPAPGNEAPAAERRRWAVELFTQGRLEEALAALEQLGQAEPDDMEALSDRGAILYMLGRPEEALKAYERIAALGSGRQEAYWRSSRAAALTAQASVYESMKEPARGLAAIEAALEAGGPLWDGRSGGRVSRARLRRWVRASRRQGP